MVLIATAAWTFFPQKNLDFFLMKSINPIDLEFKDFQMRIKDMLILQCF